jgi:hypothetical protein
MTDTKKMIGVTRYQFSVMAVQFCVSLGVMLLNILIGVLVRAFSEDAAAQGGGGSGDFIILLWGVAIGLTLFGPSFKFALYNGVSRKTFYFGSLIALLGVTLVWTLITAPLSILGNAVAGTFSLYYTFYGQNAGGLFVWLFAAILFMTGLGWFITILLYRLEKTWRFILLGGVAVFPVLLWLVNVLSGGAVFPALGGFFSAVLGFGGAAPAPFIGAAFLLGFAAVLLSVIYLILRRAPAK